MGMGAEVEIHRRSGEGLVAVRPVTNPEHQIVRINKYIKLRNIGNLIIRIIS